MDSMTNYMERATLNLFKGTSFSAPSAVYVALFLSNPTDASDGGIEASYTGYERVEVEDWSTPSLDGDYVTISNVTEVSYATPSTDSGTVTHIAICDSQVGGNRLFYGELTDSLVLTANTTPKLIANEIKIKSTGKFSVDFQKKILNVLNGTSISSIAPYIALKSGDAEIIASNYSRQAITFGDIVEASNGVASITNTAKITWAVADTNWGTVDTIAVMNGSTGSEVVVQGVPQTAKNVPRLGQVVLYAGDYKVGVN